MKNYAAMLEKVENIVIRETDIPEPGPGEALIRVAYNGICGSDVHYFESGINGDNPCQFPFLLGHECSGVVLRLGENADNLKIGARVAVEPGVMCGTCEWCKEGKYNLCRDMRFLAAPPYHGSLQKYMAFPAHMLFPLPPSVSLLEGSLIEPLSVGIHAVGQAGVEMGENVMVYGAGCIGLVTILAARAAGASSVYVVDRLANRLEHASKMGATRTFGVEKESLMDVIMEVTGGKGVDKLIDTTGAPSLIGTAPELVRRGGRIVLLGSSPDIYVPINVVQLINKEILVNTVFRYRNIFPQAIRAVADGALDIRQIVSDVYDFEHAQEAFMRASHNKNETIKVLIKMDEDIPEEKQQTSEADGV